MKNHSKYSNFVFCLILTFLFFNIPQNTKAGLFVKISSPAVYINGPDTTTFELNCGDTKILPPGGTLSFYVTAWSNDILDWSYLCIDSLPDGATFDCGDGWSVTRLFTWTPPVAFSGNLRFTNQGGESCILYFDEVLPAELESFTSNVVGNNVNLNWQTSSEQNNSGFEIERSKLINGNIQYRIRAGAVRGNGNIANSSNYTFSDRIFEAGIYKYRLKRLDYNGNSEYYYLNNYVQISAPEKFELSRNYPNPFNPVTNMEFGISKLEFISLKVYDILGKEVSTLVNEIKPAGRYKVEFDGSALSSGVYFYRLEAGEFNDIKRMFLVK